MTQGEVPNINTVLNSLLVFISAIIINHIHILKCLTSDLAELVLNNNWSSIPYTTTEHFEALALA